jgi:hypothetical protein
MATFTDIITDADGDLEILNGDLFINDSDSQHVEMILTADKGQFRQFPLIGVGLRKFINDAFLTSSQAIKQAIKLQLESDGYNVRKLDVSNVTKGIIDIDATRKNIL